MITPLNFPDEIWARLKTWAKAQALVPVEPSLDECESHVRQVVREIAGDADALRAEVVAFYARETRDMFAKYRETVIPKGGVA